MTAIMKNQPTPSDREVLTRLVERITYQNAEKAFASSGSKPVATSSWSPWGGTV